MYRVSREGKRAPGTPPRSQRHRSATSYYHSARNRLHRLSTKDPWVRFGFNAAAILFVLLAVRQMHRSMCGAEWPSRLESKGRDLPSRKALYDQVEDGMQHDRSQAGLLNPFFGGGLRGAEYPTKQSLIEEIGNLKSRLAETEQMSSKIIDEMNALEKENDLLLEEVDDLQKQVAARRKLGLGTYAQVSPTLDRRSQEQRPEDAVTAMATAVAGMVGAPSKASMVHRFGKQTASNNGAKPASGADEDLPNEYAVGAKGTAVDTHHHDAEKLKADVRKSPEDRIIVEQSGGSSDKEAGEKPFKKLEEVEDVDSLDFQVKEGVDWDDLKEATKTNNNDRLSQGKSRKPSTFLRRDEGDVLIPADHDQKEGESGVAVEVDLGLTKKVEEEQLPASSGGGAPGDGSEKSSGELSQGSKEVKGVPLERPQEKEEGASGAESYYRKDVGGDTVATKYEENAPAAKDVKEPEEVPFVEAGKGDRVAEKDSNYDGEKEESAPQRDEDDKAEEPSGNPAAAGAVDPKSDGGLEKALPQVGAAKETEKEGEPPSKDAVGNAASGPNETPLGKVGTEVKENQQKFDAAGNKAKLDAFERNVISVRKDKVMAEGEGFQEEAVEGEPEEDEEEQRNFLVQKFIQLQKEASGTDDEEDRTSSSSSSSSSSGSSGDSSIQDGEVKDSSPDRKVQESDGRLFAPMGGNEADAAVPSRAGGGEERPAWVVNFPEDVTRKRDEEALKLLGELPHLEDKVEESR